MRFVVCYDITTTAAAPASPRHCSIFGRACKRASFSRHWMSSLFPHDERLKKLIEPAVDCVMSSPSCQRCGDGLIALGRADLPRDQEFYVV